jgi:predicted Zn-ribbon and HTH transcriptional regulator
MNSKNVISQKQIKKEFLCALCQAILVDPMKCKECGNHFHQACLNKFCRETGECPMLCKRPKFISIKKEIDKLLQNLKFSCANADLGCEKVLDYE